MYYVHYLYRHSTTAYGKHAFFQNVSLPWNVQKALYHVHCSLTTCYPAAFPEVVNGNEGTPPTYGFDFER